MSTEKTDFLRFSAYSIEDLITRKLSEDSKFTDQIYEGSNLKILIQIVSYMYQCLIYQLNNAASESMFADTQLYENINRLCNFIGYSPFGCTPAQLNMLITDMSQGQSQISFRVLNCAYIDTGLVDGQGKSICFSLTTVPDKEQEDLLTIKLYNGKWKVYDKVLVASGIENETFSLDLYSDSENNKYVSNSMIRVFISEDNGDSWSQWDYDSKGIFISSKMRTEENDNIFVTLTNNSEKIYTLRLSQDKSYELIFGDGIIGRKLQANSLIRIIYLDSNGKDGEIDFDSVDWTNSRFIIPEDIKNNIPLSLRKVIYGYSNMSDKDVKTLEHDFIEYYEYSLMINNSVGTPLKQSIEEESVEEIKENAPNWFKTGYRLITKNDYEYFIKNSRLISNLDSTSDSSLFQTSVIDCKCMNNVEYVSKFYKWLYLQGLKRSVSDGSYYFSSQFFNRNHFYFIDPSDSNNIYLWIKTYDTQTVSNLEKNNVQINKILDNIKITTTEINIVYPVTVYFDICAASEEYVKNNYVNSSVFDEEINTTIEITLGDNISYVSNSIQNSVYEIIIKAFNKSNQKIGSVIDFNNILTQIYQINGVKNVRTIWSADDGTIRTYEGLSFASWSDNQVLDEFEDLQVGNNLRHLEDFQFPEFSGQEQLLNRIVVVKKQMSTVNTITF